MCPARSTPALRRAFGYPCRMTSFIISIVAYFIAAYYIKRWLDEMGIPKTMVRGLVIFVLAAAVSYGVAYVVDLVIT